MYDISYDELYGVSLEEYLREQKITIDDLIRKVETDIKLLKERLNYLVWEKEGLNKKEYSSLITKISLTLDFKISKLNRLKKWKKELDKNEIANDIIDNNNLFYSRCMEVI